MSSSDLWINVGRFNVITKANVDASTLNVDVKANVDASPLNVDA